MKISWIIFLVSSVLESRDSCSKVSRKDAKNRNDKMWTPISFKELVIEISQEYKA
jgi:hypothetical protein